MRGWLWVLCAVFASFVAGCGDPSGSRPPNLVLVIGDDHRYSDFGFMGSTVAHTPRLDRLAAEGVVFRVGYSTASVCRPALRTLLTGLEPLQYRRFENALARRGVPSKPAGPVVRRLDTLPRLLAERGYASFQAGKYLEGGFADGGFDEGMVVRGGRPGRDAASRLARRTMAPVLDFIDRNAERPFFLWFAPKLPHIPHDAPREYHAHYLDAGLGPREQAYFAAVSWFDAVVGQLVDHLDENGLRDDTLIVYLADNGWDTSLPEHVDFALIGGPRGKKSLHEQGFRTPVVVRWPTRVAPGRVRDELVSIADAFPTLLDYAGVEVPPSRGGRSLRPLLEGSDTWSRSALMGWMDHIRGDALGAPGGGLFWRDPRWHYLAPIRGGAALYDVSADPGETTNLIARHPRVARRARAEIASWRAALPTPAAGEVP